MANVLEIREDKKFGCHIVTKAVTAKHRVCNKREQNFVACTDGSNVSYFRGSCAKQIDFHRLECRTIFHVIDASFKLPVQTLLMAIHLCTTIDGLLGGILAEIMNMKYRKLRTI